MPHKRAKRSLREKKRGEEGHDLRPEKLALGNEDIPKGAARIINAAKVQEAYHKKRKLGLTEDDGDKTRKKKQRAAGDEEKKIRIMPGESLTHFNRRVEDSLRPLVHNAMQSSAAIARKVRKEELQDTTTKPSSKLHKHSKHTDAAGTQPVTSSNTKNDHDGAISNARVAAVRATEKGTERPKEFATLSTSVPRRLNDIVQAPPEIKRLPRGAKARQTSKSDGTNLKGQSLREGVLSMAQKALLEQERNRVIKAYREMKKRSAAAG